MFFGLLYCADCGAKIYFCTCNTYKDNSQNHFVCSNYKSNTGSYKIHFIREQVLYRIVLETIQRTLIYVRMFRKDFKLEMLAQAQDEESRKVKLAEKQKALSGRKNGWKIWTGLSSTSVRTTCWAGCQTAGTKNYPANTRRSRQRLSSLPLCWNMKLRHRPGMFPM